MPNKKKVRFAKSIETAMASCSKFSKREQICTGKARRLQCILGFLPDNTLMCLVMTNSTCDNLISKKDAVTCNEMLSKSVHVAKEKRTMR